MTLKKGTLLGPYSVDSLLGAGGMGEVYRARDTRLDRTVAIKVLLPSLTASDERRARFEREARAISALSSPHICALYDVGHADDVEYLVMEYLEGETLADRIARGPLPLSQILRYATEIADALRDAHRAGITHRDLKPGNVMLTASGVKLLDFGLAKLETQNRIFSADSAPATLINPITAEGTIVGTFLYMAPEQLEGRSVDQRTDIFCLGVIMYEMVTGQRPFAGSSPLSVIAAIVSADPVPIRSLQPSCPAALERIILTALEKNPDDRWQTAQDVARQLRWLTEPSGSTSTGVLPAIPAKASRRRLLLALPIAAILGALVAWSGMRFFSPANTQPTTRLQLSPPDDVRGLPSSETPNFAVAPDGRTLAFIGIKAGTSALFLRQLDSYDVRKIDGSEGGSAPFWSSDGQWIGFSAHGKLWKTKAATGGVPLALCNVLGSGAIASWVGDTILFADRAGGRKEIYRVADGGGQPVKVTTLKSNEWRHAWPHLLADGRHFLYQASMVNSVEHQLLLASLDSPGISLLATNISQARMVAANQLIYVRDAKLVTQRIDIDKGKLIGEPALVADNIAYFYPSGRADFDATNGVIVFRTETSTGRLTLADRNGKSRVIDDQSVFQNLSAAFSSDGNRAAVTVLDRRTGLGDIWIYDFARGGRDRFTNEPGLALTPVWSPNGKSIVYSAAAAGTLPHVVRRPLASSSTLDTLTPPGRFQFAGSFSPDASTLFITREDGATSDIFRLDMKTLKEEPLLNTTFDESDPQASPDGKWLAFATDATGTSEVYLQSLTTPDMPRIRISTKGGESPRWRRDNGELFYLSAQQGIMSVKPASAGDWSNTTATELFRAPSDTLRYDARPDGQSFLFVEGSHGASDALFHVILGWH